MRLSPDPSPFSTSFSGSSKVLPIKWIKRLPPSILLQFSKIMPCSQPRPTHSTPFPSLPGTPARAPTGTRCSVGAGVPALGGARVAGAPRHVRKWAQQPETAPWRRRSLAAQAIREGPGGAGEPGRAPASAGPQPGSGGRESEAQPQARRCAVTQASPGQGGTEPTPDGPPLFPRPTSAARNSCC